MTLMLHKRIVQQITEHKCSGLHAVSQNDRYPSNTGDINDTALCEKSNKQNDTPFVLTMVENAGDRRLKGNP